MGDQDNLPPPEKTRSEDAFGKTWDRCITDLLVKMGGGLGLGVVFSVVLLGRRPWPLVFGLGSGFGMAYSNCQKAFNEPLAGKYPMVSQIKPTKMTKSEFMFPMAGKKNKSTPAKKSGDPCDTEKKPSKNDAEPPCNKFPPCEQVPECKEEVPECKEEVPACKEEVPACKKDVCAKPKVVCKHQRRNADGGDHPGQPPCATFPPCEPPCATFPPCEPPCATFPPCEPPCATFPPCEPPCATFPPCEPPCATFPPCEPPCATFPPCEPPCATFPPCEPPCATFPPCEPPCATFPPCEPPCATFPPCEPPCATFPPCEPPCATFPPCEPCAEFPPCIPPCPTEEPPPVNFPPCEEKVGECAKNWPPCEPESKKDMLKKKLSDLSDSAMKKFTGDKKSHLLDPADQRPQDEEPLQPASLHAYHMRSHLRFHPHDHPHVPHGQHSQEKLEKQHVSEAGTERPPEDVTRTSAEAFQPLDPNDPLSGMF